MAGGRSLPAVLVPLLLAACDAGLFPMKLRQRPPAPPAAMWHPPPSAPPPTLDQRFATDARFRCARMGIRDEDECCAIRFMDKYCCQPCRLVWLNVTAAGLTERGTRYRVEQCLPEADAKLGTYALPHGDTFETVTISNILPERCVTTEAVSRFTPIALFSMTGLVSFFLSIALCVCCLVSGCPLYWKRVSLFCLDLWLGPPEDAPGADPAAQAAADGDAEWSVQPRRKALLRNSRTGRLTPTCSGSCSGSVGGTTPAYSREGSLRGRSGAGSQSRSAAASAGSGGSVGGDGASVAAAGADSPDGSWRPPAIAVSRASPATPPPSRRPPSFSDGSGAHAGMARSPLGEGAPRAPLGGAPPSSPAAGRGPLRASMRSASASQLDARLEPLHLPSLPERSTAAAEAAAEAEAAAAAAAEAAAAAREVEERARRWGEGGGGDGASASADSQAVGVAESPVAQSPAALSVQAPDSECAAESMAASHGAWQFPPESPPPARAAAGTSALAGRASRAGNPSAGPMPMV